MMSEFLRLQVVSTRVGGVPEVLPDDLIRLAEPNVTGWAEPLTVPHSELPPASTIALVSALEEAIEAHRYGNRVSHEEMHQQVEKMYTWHSVARRTERVPLTPHKLTHHPSPTTPPSLRFMTW